LRHFIFLRYDLKRILGSEKIKIFEKCYAQNSFDNLTNWKKILPNNFEPHEIRILYNFFDFNDNT